MAKVLQGIDPALISEPIQRRFWQIVKANFAETSKVFGSAIAPGNNPGPAVPDLSAVLANYLYLPGRAGGQTILEVDTSPKLIFGTPSSDDNVAIRIGSTTATYFTDIYKGSVQGLNFKATNPFNDAGVYTFDPGLGALGGAGGFLSAGIALLNGHTASVASDTLQLIGPTNVNFNTMTWVTSSHTTGGNISRLGSIIITASSQAFRAPSTGGFQFTNNAGSGFVNAILKDTSDRLIIGETNISTIFVKPTGTTIGTWSSTGLAVTGTLSATSLSGPSATLTTRGDLLTRDASSQVRLPLGTTGKFLRTDGTDPSWQGIVDADVTGTTIMRKNVNSLVTADIAIDGDHGGSETLSADYGGGGSALQFYDSVTGQTLAVVFDSAISASGTIVLSNLGGTVAMAGNIMTFTNKTFATTNNVFRTSSKTVGVAFADNTNPTKFFRMKTTNLTASTNNLLAFRGSAVRTWEFPDVNLTVVGKVGTTEDSNLTDVNVTGRLTAIGSTNLATTPAAGIYRVTPYAMCTTASGSGAPTLDVTIGWTDDVGAQTLKVYTALPLSATTTAQVPPAPLTVRVNSGNITYSTTINAASGSPQYALYLRCEAL